MTAALGTWHLARASGWVAWLLLGCTVVWGALAAGRMVAGRGASRYLVQMHRHLSRLTLVLVAVHVGALVADNWVHFGWAAVLLPGRSAWRPTAVACGVVAMYVLLVVQVSSWPALRVPRRTWRALHLLSYPAWALAATHGVLAGTDAAKPLPRLLVAALVAAVSFVVLGRLMALGRRHPPPRATGTTTGTSTGGTTTGTGSSSGATETVRVPQVPAA